MTLLNVALECGAPQMVSIDRIKLLGRGIHDQEFVAKRALPRNPADLSKECEVIGHEISMDLLLAERNLPW